MSEEPTPCPQCGVIDDLAEMRACFQCRTKLMCGDCMSEHVEFVHTLHPPEDK